MKIVAPVLFYTTIIGICIALAAIPSCRSSVDCKNPANASSASCVVQQAIVDCTAPSALDYVTQHEAEIAQFFTSTGIDWAGVEAALIRLALPEALCVLDTVVEHYLAPSSTGATATVVASQTPDDVRAQAAALSAKLWPGKTAKLR